MLSSNSLRRGSALLWVFVIIVPVIIVPAAPAQGRNAFEGTWKANIAKSQRHPNHLFQSATLRLEVAENVVTLAYTGVNMSGQEEKGTTTIYPDGKEYPVGEAPGVVQVSKWAGSNILETVARKDGKVIGQSTYEISSDGKTMTAKVKGFDAAGAEFQQVIVFDREPNVAGLRPQTAPIPPPQPTVAMPPEIARVLTDYQAAWSRRDSAALSRLFAEDGFVLPNGSSPVRGRPEVER